MTYYELKKIKRQIEAQNLEIERINSERCKTTQVISDAPKGSNVSSDKIGNTVCQLDEAKRKLKDLELKFDYYIDSIADTYIQNAIACKLKNDWSWNKIAMSLGGNNTGDGVRMMCTRYHW